MTINQETNPTRDQQIGEVIHWLVSLLNRYLIPYQIVGGLAAHAYGSTRPVVDIDLYIPMEQAQEVLEEMKPYLVRNPLHSQSSFWDLTYLDLNYRGISIQVGDSSTEPRFYNQRDLCWELQMIDYTASHKAQLYGVDVNVMPKSELLSYKAKLAREVDYADICEMDPSFQDNHSIEVKELSPYFPFVLYLNTFDDLLYDDLFEKLKEEGFQFTSLDEMGNSEEAQHKLYLLNDMTVMETAGSDGNHAWPTFEDFSKKVCQMGWFKPAGQIVTIDTATGTWAAMSAITRFEGDENAWNLHTGVDKHYSGRKLEQAVLVLASNYARDTLKVKSIFVDESKHNSILITAYKELGYVQRQ